LSDFVDKIIREHDAVVFLHDLEQTPLVAGETGVVIYVYENATTYEVEFANPMSRPRFLVATVNAEDILKLQPRGRVSRTVA